MSHGLGPYFYNLLVENIKRALFNIREVNETITEQIKKQFDIHI